MESHQGSNQWLNLLMTLSMKTYDKVWKPVGALLGTLTGYLYWHEVGCLTGHCPIQSHWESMAIWGGITARAAPRFSGCRSSSTSPKNSFYPSWKHRRKYPLTNSFKGKCRSWLTFLPNGVAPATQLIRDICHRKSTKNRSLLAMKIGYAWL